MTAKAYTYEETFRSPFVKKTEREALKVLDDIRLDHPASKGWIELEGYAEKVPGGWRAVRHHAKV